jgi:iron complex outermembrane receptor protein
MGSDQAAFLSRGSLLKMAWTAFLCAAGLSLTIPAMAMADSARFDIAAQPLPTALKAFATQAHMQLLYQYSTVANAKGNAVNGDLEKHAALEQLLKNSGLEVIYSSDSAATIRPVHETDIRSVRGDDPGGTEPPPQPTGDSLRLAQATPGQTSSDVSVEKRKEQASKKKEKEAEQLQVVVVTGSRIPQVAKESPQDVQLYTRESIENSGQATVADFLNTLPSVSVNSTEYSGIPFGSTSVQLRGLPLGTTLVLLNGRRLETVGAQSGFDVFDLNNIPLAAVDRIEVLADGSSAIYGSDAIAGVVNILLKKNFDGFEVNTKLAHVNGSNESDSSLAWGKQWSGGSFSILGSYQARGELNASDRAITASQDFRPLGGPDNNLHACNPGNIYSVDGVTPLPGLGGATFAAVPKNFTGTPSIAEFVPTAGTLNECGYINGESILPRTRRPGVLVQANQELGASTEIFAELMYSRVQEFQQSGLYSLYGEPSLVFFTAGPKNPYNPFGTTVGISGVLTAIDQGMYLDTNFFRPLVGAKGSFANTWHWEVSALQSSDWSAQHSPFSDSSSAAITSTLTAIQNALNSSNPATALNPFVPGGLGPASLVQPFFSSSFQKFAGRDRSFDGVLRGSVFDLPSGPVQLVVGGTYGRDDLSARVIEPAATSQYFSRRTWSAFAEARVPLISSQQYPQGGDVLAVTLAGRYDDYSDFGKTTNPQFGLAWRPIESLLIRGTYATAFKAPPLINLYQPQTTTLELLPDPALNGQQENMEVVSGGNPSLQPETGRSFSSGFVYDSRLIPNLRAAVTWWKVHEGEAIGFINATTILANESLFPGLIIRNPGSNGQPGTVRELFDVYTNFGNIDVAGFDYKLNYQYRSAYGTWMPGLSATRTTHYDGALQPGLPPVDGASKAQMSGNWAPRWKGIAALGWTLGPLSANIDGRYVGHYIDYDGIRELGNFWLYDAHFRYDLGQRFSANDRWLHGMYLEVGGVNVLNKQPQYSNFSFFLGYDPQQADLQGRVIYGQLGVKF